MREFVVDRPVYRRAGAGGTGGYRLTIKVEETARFS